MFRKLRELRLKLFEAPKAGDTYLADSLFVGKSFGVPLSYGDITLRVVAVWDTSLVVESHRDEYYYDKNDFYNLVLDGILRKAK